MKLRLHKLSSEPEVFLPIPFFSGINLILGEKVNDGTREGQKVNGVGKSLCVEFLHFALLREYERTRVARIPVGVLPSELVVILDLSVNDEVLQIRRSYSFPQEATIIYKGQSQLFGSIAEATGFLEDLLYSGTQQGGVVSFRSLLSLLMRDEASEFSSITNPFSIQIKVPADPSPHLFLLGIDLRAYRVLLDSIKALNEQVTLVKRLKTELTEHHKKDIGDITEELNQEKDDIEVIEQGLAKLQAEPAYESIELELNSLEADLANLRSERKKISYQINQIQSLPKPEHIDITDVAIIYNRVKSGLGDLVSKSLEQAQDFKDQISTFQRSLLKDEVDRLQPEYGRLNELIQRASTRYSELVTQLDQKGAFHELRVGLTRAVAMRERFVRRDSALQQFHSAEAEKEDLKLHREMAFLEFRKHLEEVSGVQAEMNQVVGDIHEDIMGMRGTAFHVLLDSDARRKYPLDLELRIPDDGSHSVDRTKVFIYDVALLLAPRTRARHPGFLLHDNIFDVDQDTLVQCLNYLHTRALAGLDFQYILTLNREKILAEERANLIKFDVEALRRATLTKIDPFLRVRYQENSKRKKDTFNEESADKVDN